MARSEYSTLRNVVMKRLHRLEEQGLTVGAINIPFVRDLKTTRQKNDAIRALKGFLASPETTVRGAKKSGKVVASSGRNWNPGAYTEKQLRDRAKRIRAKEIRQTELGKLTNRQRGFIKGAKTIGINIPTSQIPVFVEYMEYRFSQIQESQFYTFATYAEDFESASKKNPSGVKSILSDYSRYKAERESWLTEFGDLAGYSESYVMDTWADFIGSL